MQAVVFDLDDTLYAYGPSHRAGIEAASDVLAAPLGLAPAAVEAAYEEARAAAFRRLGPIASAHSRALALKWTIEGVRGRAGPALAVTATRAYWQAALDALRPVDGCRELLARLGRAGLRLAVLTDLTVDVQLEKLVRLGLEDCFDAVVTSEEAGRDKPDAAPFRLVLERLGTPADRTVMIGNDPVHDVAGAAAAGLPAVLVGPPPAAPLPPGARHALSLATLLEPAWLSWLGAA